MIHRALLRTLIVPLLIAIIATPTLGVPSSGIILSSTYFYCLVSHDALSFLEESIQLIDALMGSACDTTLSSQCVYLTYLAVLAVPEGRDNRTWLLDKNIQGNKSKMPSIPYDSTPSLLHTA